MNIDAGFRRYGVKRDSSALGGLIMVRLSGLWMVLVIPAAMLLGAGERTEQGSLAGASDRAVRVDDARLTGLVRHSRLVTISAPLDGVISEMAVVESQSVKSGDVLVKFDDEIQVAVVSIAGMDVKRERMALGEAEIQYERIVQLHASGAAQEWEVRRSKLQRDAAQVAVESAEQKLKLEAARLKQYTVAAPFDGEVMRISAEEGARLKGGDPLIIFVSRAVLEAHLFLPSRIMSKMEIGKTYRFMAGAPIDRELTAALKTVEQNIDDASDSFRAVFMLNNAASKYPAGFTVRLMME